MRRATEIEEELRVAGGYDTRTNHRHYLRWDLILNGDTWTLLPGFDFPEIYMERRAQGGGTRIQENIRKGAARYGAKVSAVRACDPDRIIVRATRPPNPAKLQVTSTADWEAHEAAINADREANALRDWQR